MLEPNLKGNTLRPEARLSKKNGSPLWKIRLPLNETGNLLFDLKTELYGLFNEGKIKGKDVYVYPKANDVEGIYDSLNVYAEKNFCVNISTSTARV